MQSEYDRQLQAAAGKFPEGFSKEPPKPHKPTSHQGPRTITIKSRNVSIPGRTIAIETREVIIGGGTITIETDEHKA